MNQRSFRLLIDPLEILSCSCQSCHAFASRRRGTSGFRPSEHVAWLRPRPADYYDDERRLFFVHAGIDPFAFLACDEAVRLWTRSDLFINAVAWPDRPELAGLTVVHGHTALDLPVPEIQARREASGGGGGCFRRSGARSAPGLTGRAYLKLPLTRV